MFSIPKAFTGHIGLIQTNAIESWRRMPGAEVILFGDEEGLEAAAKRTGARHEPLIARNEFGTPLVSDAFDRARRLATHQILAFVNTDIIFTSDFVHAVTVLEVGCGAGQGVGDLASVAKSVRAGDCSATLLNIAREHYGVRFAFEQFDAGRLP